uniref:C-type lectin domain-containing protein n=1 Tax=Amphilophus citrinellus TaxID=61819 RepID=A0A3Q0R7H4_AMPCI
RGKLFSMRNAQQNTPMCLPGWRRFKSGCYQLSSTSNTWEFARQDCEGSGAHLVILTDKAEENFVSSFGGAEKFWIGLKAEDTSDTCVCTWTWVDGSSLCYRCAHVAQNHAWLVGPCDESYYWICEKEL